MKKKINIYACFPFGNSNVPIYSFYTGYYVYIQVEYNFREIINKFSDNNEGRGAIFAGVLGYNVHIY